MAANTRTHAAPGWADGEILTPAQINAVDLMAAASVRRDATLSGTKLLPLCPAWAAGQTVTCTAGDFMAANTGVANDVTLPLIGLVTGHTLTGVSVHIHPKGGHGGGGPATLPVITLYTKSSSGVLAPLGTGTYVWNGAVDPAQYEAGVSLSITGLAHVVNLATNQYIVVLAPEDAAGALGDLHINSISATMTIDTAEGGADLSAWV